METRTISHSAGAEVRVRKVRADGAVEEIGVWRPVERVLELSGQGYPLLGRGRHAVEGDHPWVFDEMAPDGFLAERFSRWHEALGLPPQRKDWSAGQVLQAITLKGHDLSGNLLVGEQSHETFLRLFRSGTSAGPDRQGAVELYDHFVDAILREPGQSSVGGARPKFALRLGDGAGLIVKFTPPLATEAGRRWSDLLRMEAHCAAVLTEAGLPAVTARYLERGERGFLEIERFDRVPGGGRRGHVTMYYLGMALYSEYASAARVISGLVRDGHLPQEDGARFERQQRFSSAIGNTDTHQGNYGLLIDDSGRARLSPAYDVLPMAFAPRHDELPDRHASAFPPAADEETATLVSRLVSFVAADAGLSPGFREAWLGCLAQR